MVSFEDAEVFLPKYLSPESRKQLFAELKNFEHINYFCVVDDPEPLQGDGWMGVSFVDLDSSPISMRSTSIVVISNSCDIAQANQRKLPPRITISPLIRLSRMVALLQKNGIDKEYVDQYCRDLRAQEVTNAFFLPRGAGIEEDSVVVLDNVQSIRLDGFAKSSERKRTFTLSQSAFWLYLVKLAIHYCRAQEGILRTSAQVS